MKTPFKSCPDCGAHLDPNEVCECKKKTASSGDTLKAETADSAKQVNNIVPQKEDGVKSSFDPEAFIKMLKDIDPGRYYMKWEEVNALDVYRGKDFYMAVVLAFSWGFVRGQQAEKNRAKRAKAKKVGAA